MPCLTFGSTMVSSGKTEQVIIFRYGFSRVAGRLMPCAPFRLHFSSDDGTGHDYENESRTELAVSRSCGTTGRG